MIDSTINTSEATPRPRNRIAAALLATIVAIAGFLFVESAFRPSARPVSARAAAAPSAYLIAYAGGNGGGPQIFTMWPDGSERTALTMDVLASPSAPYPAWEPAWSPDGTQIAFRGFWGDGEYSDLFVMNADGSALRQLTTDANADNPAWSPDGSLIAFGGIRTIHPDGTGLAQLAVGEDPSWSPDGQRIAFDDEHGIAVMSPTGDDLVRLTDHPGNLDPSWSPDGSQIIFVSDRTGNPSLWLMAADGSNIRELTSCAGSCINDGNPSWSPDGSIVMFLRDGDIYTVHPDGTELTNVTNDRAGYFGPVWDPVPRSSAPSPPPSGTISLPADAIPEGGLLLQTASGAEIVRSGDGTSLAIPGVGAPLALSPDGSTVLGSTDAGLVAVDVGSGEVRLLVGAAGGGVFVSAQWSPDGTIVAYTAEGADGPEGGSTLCTVTVDSLQQTCFPELGHVYSFDWAPDGERLVVAGPPSDPLRILDVSTETLVQVTPQEGDTAINDAIQNAGMGTSFQLVDPTWSPSGAYLAALANLRDSPFAYVPVVFTPDGRFVAFGRPSGEYPQPFEWSPTRDVLAYTRGEAPYRITEGYLLDPATGEEETLVAGNGSDPFIIYGLVWSPSGRWLAIAAWQGVGEAPQMSLVVVDALDPTSFQRFPLDTGGIAQFLGGWGP